MARCSICHTLIQEGEESRKCDQCGQEYHAQCWTENRGCATYGCKAAPVSEKPTLPAAPHMGWGDEKTCPVCDRKIPSSLLVCRFCNARFPYADPMSRGEYADFQAVRNRATTARRVLVVLFILTVIGFPAPIAGILSGILAYVWRKLLLGPDGAYLALGFGSGVIGCCYTILLVLVIAGK
jgi:hypothetical protein